MYEYYSEALVLATEPVGEFDTRFSLFTKRFGKIIARGKRSRKITSKLSPHLQPGNVVAVRAVERQGLRVVDALKKANLGHQPYDLALLNRLLPEAEVDEGLWTTLFREPFDWKKVLAYLGWDPRGAMCSRCKTGKPEVFEVRSQEFFCGFCASKLGESEVISI